LFDDSGRRKEDYSPDSARHSLKDVSVLGNGLLEVLSKSLKFIRLATAVAKDGLNAGGSDGMVEVLVLLEPGASGFVLVRVLEGLVDGHEVLGAAH